MDGEAERFNRTLKEQIIHGCIYCNIEELRNAVRAFVKQYNESRISQMNCQFEDVPGRFCYKNQCDTIIPAGEPRVTRWVTPENPICGSISTVA